MIEAGARSIRCDLEVGRTPQHRTAQRAARNAWVTMRDVLAAAPTPPAVPNGEPPDGWVLVPRVATEAMRIAATKDHEGDFFLPFSLWKSMLAAAPTPPAVPNGEPPDWAIAQAFRESLPWSHEPDRMLVVLQHAKELARSAAAKGEG